MTSTSLWVQLINSAPTKNNKLTALSPVYKGSYTSISDGGAR